MEKYYEMLQLCDENNYEQYVEIVARETYDSVTGISILDIINDAAKNNGVTNLGDLRNALSEYYSIYFDFYDAVYPSMVSVDSIRKRVDMPTRRETAVGFKIKYFDYLSERASDEKESDNKRKRVFSQSIGYFGDYLDAIGVKDNSVVYSEPFYPTLYAMNRYVEKKCNNGYTLGQVDILLEAYFKMWLTGQESMEDVDQYIKGATEQGLLTSEGEITPRCIKKRIDSLFPRK